MATTRNLAGDIEGCSRAIDALDQEIFQLQRRRAGLVAELKLLRKGRAADPAGGPLTLSEACVRFVESKDAPVRVAEVIAHLDAMGVAFNPKGISALLARAAEPGGRLRKAGHGLVEVRPENR